MIGTPDEVAAKLTKFRRDYSLHAFHHGLATTGDGSGRGDAFIGVVRT
jgi:hypothetical protein